MRVNGYLQCLVQSNATVNEWGETVAGDTDWSELVPCSIRTVSDSQTASYGDGTYKSASYNVLLDVGLLRGLYEVLFYRRDSIVRARLFRGFHGVSSVGDFTVTSIEYIATSNRLQVVLS